MASKGRYSAATRLFDLLPKVEGRRQYPSVGELESIAAELGVTIRTVRRDLGFLRSVGRDVPKPRTWDGFWNGEWSRNE